MCNGMVMGRANEEKDREEREEEGGGRG